LIYKEKGEFRKALSLFEQARETFLSQNDSLGLAVLIHNIGSVYLKSGDYQKAILNFNHSLRISRALPGATVQIENLTFLSDAYLKLGKRDSALIRAKAGIMLARKEKAAESLMRLNKILYEANKSAGNYADALKGLEEFNKYRDTLFTKEKEGQFRELQTRYETEKKEQQIELLSKEKSLQEANLERRTLQQKFLVGLIILIVFFAAFMIWNNRKRQKAEKLLFDEQLLNEKREADRLVELDMLKSRFFANIAHEFRTPLTLITGPVENLLDELKSKYHKGQLELVRKNAGRLLRLINQLLDLSKLESGTIKMEYTKQDFIGFVKGITFSFQSLADEKDIQLGFQSSIHQLQMDFDQDKLEKILYNLLSNAFKFTPSLGTINVGVALSDGIVEISIKDSGVGIAAEQIPLVFDRFYQADNAMARNIEGSGIGLALTKELVEIHGGKIKVEGVPGATLFQFTLPVKNDVTIKSIPEATHHLLENIDTMISQTPLLENPESILDANEKSDLILIIEDNHEVRNFIRSTLSGSYQIIEAVDGDEGIAIARDKVPDLIISDVMMPGKDGYETCHILKEDEITNHIPVILLTAKSGVESKIEGLERGADDYLSKPFNSRELRHRIGNLISTRRKLRAKYEDSAMMEEKSREANETLEDIFIAKIRTAVEAHLDDENFSIEDLSREIGMSRTQVHRKLKALTNQSASQFMRMIRLKHAKEILKKGRYNVSEVAYMVGFGSSTYFSTCYAEHYGYAPSEELR
jgi:signal transduction histidine kinase/DNA-binding response OmpR family regulator